VASTVLSTVTLPAVTQTITTQLPASTLLSTITRPGVTSTITTQLPASTVTSLLFSTVTLPGQTVVTTLPGSTVVLTTQQPGSTFVSTILITQLLTITQVVPTTTTVVQTVVPTPVSSSLPSISCTSHCHIDVTATRLAYPGDVTVATVYVPTVTLDITTNNAGGVVGTSLYTQALPSTTSAITWDFRGVTLTWPTVYAAYATFNRLSVSAVENVCRTATLSLALPTPTVWRPLVVVESDIPNPALVAPTVVSYLNTLPTVLSQLGGPIGSNACDPIVGPVGDDPSTKTLGVTTSVESVAAVGSTSVRYVAQADRATPAPITSDSPPSASPQPPASSAAPSPPPSSAASPSPPAPPSNTPIPSPSATLQPSGQASVPSSAPSPPPPPPSSSAPRESSRADSASQVPSPPAPSSLPEPSSDAPSSPPPVVPSSASPPPPVTVGRSTTTSKTLSDGTASAPRPSSSYSSPYTGAAAIPTGNIAGWLVGAAGLGLGLF
jgi:hypothetical protein